MEPGADPLGGLMAAAQLGDSAAYRRLLVEVAPVVRRMIARHWAGLAEVEDIAQDVLLSLHLVRGTYDPARPFLPWLAAIVHHRLADAQRRHMQQDKIEAAAGTLSKTIAIQPFKDPVEAREDACALRRAIDHLPEGQRRALELIKLRELSLKQAAAISGMTIPALKVSIHRGIRALRAAMGG